MPNKDVSLQLFGPFAWFNALINTIIINNLQQSQSFFLKKKKII